jgi:hypothetical protein
VGSVPAVAVRARRELCADASGAAHEDLAATASRVDHWVLVEYRGYWDRDVLGGSLLSQALKEHLRDQLGQLGHSRLLFVKRPERRSQKRRMLFVGSSRPGEERFYALEFDHHDDLIDYDFASALLGGDTPGVPVEHPLFVVCTHGKRDRCCAKYGRPLYDQLKGKVDPQWVWQSTHVGGDRFAGNVVLLPEGLFFGRVGEEGLDPILDDYFEGRVNLERFRGRCRRRSSRSGRRPGLQASTTSSSSACPARTRSAGSSRSAPRGKSSPQRPGSSRARSPST